VFRDLRSLKIRAYAKINLDLRVFARRADGYHELRTIFQTVALHDTLSFTHTRAPFELRVSGETVPADSRNIVWKAARSVWSATGRTGEPYGLSVQIVKRIPVEAGLGGGSSDAAAALRALRRLWGAKLSARDMFDLAATLGSDVPFFLIGGTALAVGRGEVLYPLPELPGRHVVIARPQEGVSTADAYRWFDDVGVSKPGVTELVTVPGQRLEVAWAPGAIEVRNDFEHAVYARVPEARRLRDALAACGAEVAMLSGSGSAVFGLFSSQLRARTAAARVGDAAGRVWQTAFQPRPAAGRTA
jgi:4-diphosphocytidyl-2-C-methyl-D-erythritol kinase